jgi:hypothetical protein
VTQRSQETSASHQIKREDFHGYRPELCLASSSDKAGNWKRIIGVVNVDARSVEFQVQTLSGPTRQYDYLSDAILAYNGEPG